MYTDPGSLIYTTLTMPYETAIYICCILFFITNTGFCSSNGSHYRLCQKQCGSSWLFQLFRCLYDSKSITPLRANTRLFKRLLVWICKCPESCKTLCASTRPRDTRESVCMFPGRVCSLDFGLWHCCGC